MHLHNRKNELYNEELEWPEENSLTSLLDDIYTSGHLLLLLRCVKRINMYSRICKQLVNNRRTS